jgi:hypothetical protein
MTNQVLLTVEATSKLIREGKILSLAGDEKLLSQLPKGNWIGGSIPYFMGDEGGVETSDLLFVTELSGAVSANAVSIKTYSVDTIHTIATDAPENGYTIVILPAMSAIHADYANHARDFDDMFIKPVVGWIAGVHLSNLGTITPKVANGVTGEILDAQAVALHVALPENKLAVVHILNLFRQDTDGDIITFPATGFTAINCKVNGQDRVFADYIAEKNLSSKLPLVADYSGAQINTSFQEINHDSKKVSFYAPVFEGIEYRQAAQVGDYVHDFNALAEGEHQHIQFSCNCILNYLYGELQGRKTGDLQGPITFGEVAYQLLNQTLVYLDIETHTPD